jgi:hypothetical protein
MAGSTGDGETGDVIDGSTGEGDTGSDEIVGSSGT